jgi:phospholipase C
MKSVPRLYYALLLVVVVIALIFYGCQGVKQSSSSDPNSPNNPGNPSNPGSPGTTPSSPTPPSSGQPGQINHIVVMLQENRSFDSYFGRLSAYWAAHGYPPQPFDGISLNASNPGCDPSFPGMPCIVDQASPAVPVFHFQTVCMELTFPGWSQAHTDRNRVDSANGPATMDGFVETAADLVREEGNLFHDRAGRRAMGYYDGSDLNYYYFMASNFATSDRWFSPVMARTEPNRMYLQAATSHGHVQELGATSSPPLPDKTIFELLQENGITWKIYVKVDGGCITASCLINNSFVTMFAFASTIVSSLPQNIASMTQYFSDVANGTLPQVAFIEPAGPFGLDEHPSVTSPVDIQAGAAYVASIVNALMNSPSWQDSAFILSYDEFGGTYDHVPPQPAASPDGITPTDLPPGDACTHGGGVNCDFTQTGFRVPLIVISPFAKKNYVSHTVADYTAILKFIEQRFNLPSLTARDAAQMDMSEFFDMANPPWMTPPSPPAQNHGGACYLDHLP